VATIGYFEYSKRDFEYAVGNLSLGFYDPCGRFCQQSVEKRMKHYIEQNGDASDFGFFTTHNLGRLYDRICQIAGQKNDKAVRGDLSKLTDYYFDTNYPKAMNIELTQEMAQEAVDIAAYVNEWIDGL